MRMMRSNVFHEFEKILLFNMSSAQRIELLAPDETGNYTVKGKCKDFYAWLLMTSMTLLAAQCNLS